MMIAPKSLGDKLWLVDVSPAYEYRDNRRTDTILGYRYAVAMPEKGLDKINVRIDGKRLMEAPDGYVEVHFDNLEVFIYWSQGHGCPFGEYQDLMHWEAPAEQTGIGQFLLKKVSPGGNAGAALLP